MNMQRKRILYVPGLISLMLLPLLCFFVLKPYGKKYGFVEVVTAARYIPHPDNNLFFQFDTSCLSLPESRRKYRDFHLNGEGDERLLETIEERIHTIAQSRDVVNGVHVVFGDQCHHRSFIRVIELFKNETGTVFIHFENQAWFFYKKTVPAPKVTEVVENLAGVICGFRGGFEEETPPQSLIFNSLYIDLGTIWPAWLVFLPLSFLSIRKMNHTRKPNRSMAQRQIRAN